MSVLSLITTAQSTSPGATETFSGLNFGTDDASRVIIVAFGWASSGNFSVSSVTIGGVTATAAVVQGNGTGIIEAIYYAQPSGTSGDVVVTMSAAGRQLSLAVYRGGVSSVAPASANSVQANGATETVAVSAKAGGFWVMSARHAVGGVTISDSYNGVDTPTDDFNGAVGAEYIQAHCLTTETASRQAGITGGTATTKTVAVASWSGAAATSSALFRRTLSPLGARIGSRQVFRG